MKNLSRRDFLRLSGAAVFAVGMTGALSGCDSSHVNTVTVQTVEFNEEVKTAYGKVKFTSRNIQYEGENKSPPSHQSRNPHECWKIQYSCEFFVIFSFVSNGKYQ